MAIRRARHCVYDTRYHLVWAPKYRKGEYARDSQAFPGVRKQFWGGEFGEDGYVTRTVGDQVTTEVSKKYIRFHEAKKGGGEQLYLF